MSGARARPGVRLAELLAMLSLGTDLGMGQPMEHVLRQSLIALRLSERLGLEESDRGVIYYVGLLAWVGCDVDAYEQAKWFGDDTAFKGDSRRVDMGRPLPAAAFMLRHLGGSRPVLARVRLGIAFLGDGRHAVEDMIENHWVATNELAARLGLGHDVRESLYQTFERWDGKGVPAQAAGPEISVAARLVNLCRAGLVHDLGRLGVSNAIWDKRGSLTAAELERVRLHPYLTERMLASSAALRPLGEIAVQHHERVDGSGHPRGLTGYAMTPPGKLLAAADAYHAMSEPRPHRPARPPEEAAAELRSAVRRALFDADAVDAVLRAAGHSVQRRGGLPAGLTRREVEVLTLMVRELSNKQIA